MRLRWGLVVTLALVPVACGSEDGSGAAQDPSPSSTAPVTTTDATTAPTTVPLVSVDPTEVGTGATTTAPSAPTAGPAPTTTTPAAAIPATSLAGGDQPSVEIIGSGRPQWFSTDGSTVVVAAALDPPSPTCQGSGQPELFRQPLDDQPRSVAVLGDNADAVGVMTRPGPGRLALAEGCLGTQVRLWVGDEAGNGLTARVVEQPLSSPTIAVGAMTSSADGAAFIGSHRPAGTGDPTVVRVDAETGQVTTLFAGEYLEVIELADGTFVVRSGDDVRLIGTDGTLVDARDGGAIAASPDRSVYVVFTASTIEVVDVGGESRSVARPGDRTDELGSYQPVVADDRTVVFTRRAARANPVWELRPDGALIELLPADEWGALVTANDGSRLATSRPVGDPDQPFAEEAVLITR